MVSISKPEWNDQSNKSISPKSINHNGQKDSVDLIKFAEDIINQLSSEQIYNLYNHEFQADGNGKLRGKPPFRESKSGTSFTVYPDKGFYDAGGNFAGYPMDYIHSIKIGYYERAKKKDWVNALKELANIAGVEFPSKFNNSDQAQKWINRQNILTHAYEYLHHALLNPNNPNSVKAIEYLHSRGINDETIKTLKIGFYDSWAGINNYLISKGFTPDEIKAVGLQRGKFVTKDGVIDSKNSCTWVNFITFPWLDVNGNPLSLYGRYFEKKPPNTKTPKTLALPGSHTKKHPFLFYICKENNHKEVIFVEGLFDAIALYQAGITNVCSGIGASFSNEQINCLSNYKIKKVTHLGDPDGGGENGTKSNLKRLLKKEIDVFVPEKLPEGLDPDEFIEKYGIDKLIERMEKPIHGLRWLAQCLANSFKRDREDYVANIYRKSCELRREYSFISNRIWDSYFTDEIYNILDLDKSELKASIEAEKENLEEELIENLEEVEEWENHELAMRLSEKYQDILAWDSEIREWRRYEAELPGVWSVEYPEYVSNIIANELYQLSFDDRFRDEKTGFRKKISSQFVSSILNTMKGIVGVRKWDSQDPKLLPLHNGVFNLITKQLSPHCPGNKLTWILPYDYNPLATCNPILDWLFQMAKNEGIVQLIRAYLKAIVTGNVDLQRYIELIGPGGSGKSTLMRLAQALVGTRNSHTTTLDALENSRFECASIKDKRLVLITDSDRYGGQVSKLKALTGQDSLPYEVKFKQSTGGFMPQALVMVAANEPIQSADYTSGLTRRRITLPFNNKIPNYKQRNLITITDESISGEFADYIPGLLNWVLGMPDDEMISYLKDTDNQVPYLQENRLETLCDTNPLADWANLHLVLRKGNKAYVGIKSGNAYAQLYASYCFYAENSGTKAVALRRFSNLLHDLFNNQLNIPLKKYRDTSGYHFLDIAVRHPSDLDPLLITGNYIPDDDNPSDDDNNGGGNIPKPTPPTPPPPPSNTQDNTKPDDDNSGSDNIPENTMPTNSHPPCNTRDNTTQFDASTQSEAYCENLASDSKNVGKNEGKIKAEPIGSVGTEGNVGKSEKSAPSQEKNSTVNKNPESEIVLEKSYMTTQSCTSNDSSQQINRNEGEILPAYDESSCNIDSAKKSDKWADITQDDLAPIDQIIEECNEGLWKFNSDDDIEGLLEIYPVEDLMIFWAQFKGLEKSDDELND